MQKYKSDEELQKILSSVEDVCAYCTEDLYGSINNKNVMLPTTCFPKSIQERYSNLEALSAWFHHDCLKEAVNNMFNFFEDENIGLEEQQRNYEAKLSVFNPTEKCTWHGSCNKGRYHDGICNKG